MTLRLPGKKGITTQVVVYIVLSLFVLFVLFLFIAGYREKSEPFISKETCKQSVNTASLSKLRIIGYQLIDKFGSSGVLKCSTKYTVVPVGKEKEFIANAMFDCWDMYGQGKKEVFDTATGTFCAICERLEFSRQGRVQGLTDYLIKTKIPMSDTSYFRFLNSVEISDSQVLAAYENSNLKNKDDLDASEPLAVVFVMAKKPSDDRWKGSAIGAIAGGLVTVAGVLLLVPSAGTSAVLIVGGVGAVGTGTAGYWLGSSHGSTYWSATVLLWRYDHLRDLGQCTVLEGRASLLSVVSAGTTPRRIIAGGTPETSPASTSTAVQTTPGSQSTSSARMPVRTGGRINMGALTLNGHTLPTENAYLTTFTDVLGAYIPDRESLQSSKNAYYISIPWTLPSGKKNLPEYSSYISEAAWWGRKKLLLTNPANGKQVVGIILDKGPANWVINKARGKCQNNQATLIDADPRIAAYLFGRNSVGWSDCKAIKISFADQSMPVGPVKN